MQTEGKTISFKGQNIYVGIDAHLKNWTLTILTENAFFKTFSQDPCAMTLKNYLHRIFPQGTYYSAYEAGFCGFSVHRELVKCGIQNIVVNPADIPITDKEKRQKEDRRDSKKIARSLRNRELTAIYVPDKSVEELRGLVRYRKVLVKEIGRTKNRIKSFLYFNGIAVPVELDSASKYWSGRFTQWLKTIKMETEYGNFVLQETVENTEYSRGKLLKIDRKFRELRKSSSYSKTLGLLQSIPGIGPIVSITLLTELGDLKRFNNLDKLCSFVGLIPTTNSSGENEKTGQITPRAKKPLRNALVESAWVAIKHDPALNLVFNELCKRMKSNEAIIRIAKKLLGRMRYVIKNETEYVHSIV